MSPFLHRLLPVVSGLLTCLSGGMASAQSWSPEVDFGWLHNDNVTNSIRQQKDDSAATVSASLQQVRVLSRDWQGSLKLGADTEFWRDYSGLNLSQFSAEGGRPPLRSPRGILER